MPLKFKAIINKQQAEILLSDFLAKALDKVIRENLSIAIDELLFEVEIKENE
jgi:hypothetical protein